MRKISTTGSYVIFCTNIFFDIFYLFTFYIELINIYFRYKEYNCSLEVVAGVEMDGVTAVVEHLDLRGEEPEQWRHQACPDYLYIRSEQSRVRRPLCGQWDVERDHQLTMFGHHQNLFGYCVEDRSGHSCETKRILVDVAIEHNASLSDSLPALRKSDRHGFTVVFTAWKHAEDGSCPDDDMVCPNTDGGVHADKNHCIWQKMMCDGHQNCGFLANKDEWGCRLGRDTPWSFGTITVLVTIWIAIVTVLMLATVFLLQWNRVTFRTPLDVLTEGRQEPGRGVGTLPVTERLQGGHVMSTASAPDPRTGGMVSIMVMYRPPNSGEGEAKTVDLPPTYESLYQGENPPGYNMLTVNIPSNDQQAAAASRASLVDAVDTSAAALQAVEIGDATGAAISSDSMQSNISQAIGILQRVASAQTGPAIRSGSPESEATTPTAAAGGGGGAPGAKDAEDPVLIQSLIAEQQSTSTASG